MKLLVFTQKVDRADPVLGFFYTWIVEFARIAESVTVICLQEGEHMELPRNVTVYSLGKEKHISRFQYVKNLYQYLFLIRGTYTSVFVHMNQEYVLLAGAYWKYAGIPVYFWRNHSYGNVLTRIAVFLSTKVFCTSTYSFTARFRKTTIMPAGIDTQIYKILPGSVRKKYSVCIVGRISPVKHIELGLQAVNYIVQSGGQISLSVIGSPLDRDSEYYDGLKKYVSENSLSQYIQFVSGVPFEQLPVTYNSHEICLNLTDDGSFDKTIVEAAACGCIPLVSNRSLEHLLPSLCITDRSVTEIANSLKKVLDAHEQVEIQGQLQGFVNKQSLATLMKKFEEIML